MAGRVLAIVAITLSFATGVAACGGGGGDAGGAAPAAAPAPATVVPNPGAVANGPGLVVTYNPYSKVVFAQTPRLLAQHHDHAGVTLAKLQAYDEAGYNVLSLQDYSGNPRLSYAWTARRWPPDKWLPKDFMAALKNLELFLPNAEEVGIAELHVTSTFVQKYIESAPDVPTPPEPWQYKTGTELIRLVSSSGGVPCLAHPFEPLLDTNYWSGQSLPCIEVYTAYAEGLKEQGQPYFTARDRNEVLRANWDRLLRENPRTLGIAVNDHFGPDTPRFVKLSPQTRDSGKVLVFAATVDLPAYEDAFRRGAFFAITDRGEVKGNFPFVREIVVFDESIWIDTDGDVKWFTNFGQVVSGNLLLQADLREGTTYARAEISNAEGSVVYTQAFSIGPRGSVVAGPDDGDDCLDAEQPQGGPGPESGRCASN
jgi:hypothetical protein